MSPQVIEDKLVFKPIGRIFENMFPNGAVHRKILVCQKLKWKAWMKTILSMIFVRASYREPCVDIINRTEYNTTKLTFAQQHVTFHTVTYTCVWKPQSRNINIQNHQHTNREGMSDCIRTCINLWGLMNQRAALCFKVYGNVLVCVWRWSKQRGG